MASKRQKSAEMRPWSNPGPSDAASSSSPVQPREVDTSENDLRGVIRQRLLRADLGDFIPSVCAVLEAASWRLAMFNDSSNEQRLVTQLEEPWKCRDECEMFAVSEDQARKLFTSSGTIAANLIIAPPPVQQLISPAPDYSKLPEGAAATLVQIAERVNKEKRSNRKRRYSDYFGEVFGAVKSMRLDCIPGLLSQEYEDEKIEGDGEKDIDFEFLTMNDFPPLMHPQRSSRIIMIRPCYMVIYGQLLEYVMNKSPRYLSENLTVTGNPGIGKSRFYLYCIFRFIKDGTNGRDLIINFGEEYHMYDFEAGEFCELQIPGCDNRFVQNPNVLRLVEAKSTKLTGWQGISILFASPGVHGLHQYQKTENRRKFIMPTWSFKELEVLNEKREYPLSSLILQRKFFLFDGIPRFIFGKDYDADVSEAIRSDEVLELFRFVKSKSPVRENHCSHLLLKMCPTSESLELEFYLDFLSENIATQLFDRFEESCHDQLVSFIISNMNDPNTATVRGRFYEVFCHRRLGRGIELRGHHLESHDEFKLDIADRVQVRYFSSLAEITELKLEECVYFIPKSKIFGALDSFYWDGTDCFACQITISQSHPLSHAKLKEFLVWFQGLSSGVVSFLFVVPSRVSSNFVKQQYVSTKKTVMKQIAPEISRISQYVVALDEFEGV